MNDFQKLFPGKVLLAPMEDVTEPPFRVICKRLGADIVYTEFISAEGLIRDARKARAKLFFYEEERPLGIQIYGGNEDTLTEAAKISESVGPDFIDINCGCWVKDVAMRGAGAGLLKDVPKMARIAEMIMNNVKLPVTLKTRLGWDENSIVIVEVAKLLESIGVQALTVHCRLRSQGNKGDADWSWVKRIKDSGVKMPIVLNGNIKTPEDVRFVFENYEPDAVMIGQAAISNPWIFRQSKYFLEKGVHEEEPQVSERVDVCIEHLRLSVERKGEIYGVKEFRKHYSGYLRGLRDVSKFRLELMQFNDFEPLAERLRRFKEEYKEISEVQNTI
ncbi:MAG: tRNA dihydrouridine synthase DusB [Ignavibacteria bacterium]|jgi:tRNA-dihydrouridine synthase B|nr:tRNA dihydrouridine synthase DusB [Ignavibacteria bacterium]MBK9226547.1 tRNA dihydrouridine synthase DusB [Ignavibacteria bacterium]